MTRRISIRSYRKPDSLYSPLDLVVCEGETEVDYLCELARSLRIHVHICKGDGTDPKSIVNTAKRKLKEDGVKYDKVFCVFDRDNDLSSFLEAIELCKSRKFIAIVSNPCFELWPYLHFQVRESGFGGPLQMLSRGPCGPRWGIIRGAKPPLIADDRTRTSTLLLEVDFESTASTISPRRHKEYSKV